MLFDVSLEKKLHGTFLRFLFFLKRVIIVFITFYNVL